MGKFTTYHSLVGGWAYPSEKYEFVSWDYCIIPNIWKNEKCSKPPTSSGLMGFNVYIQHSRKGAQHVGV